MARTEEMQRIIDATYRVIERSGQVDPTVRDILREAQLSTPAFYRSFASKDELFLSLLEDGRRRMAATTERRMAKVSTGEAKVRAWVAAVLAQARDTGVAARTRPFVASLDALVARYPEEHRVSETLLIGQLADAIAASDDLVSRDPRGDATAIYLLAFGALAWHLRNHTIPRAADVDRLVDFACRALNHADSGVLT